MKVASFNVNGVRARLAIVMDWLQAQEPDILCLQETKVQDKDFPAEAFEQAGYNVFYHGQKSYNGVAIVSKQPLQDAGAGFEGGEFSDEARVIRGTVGDVAIINTYVPQGREVGSEHFEHKLGWLTALGNLFDTAHAPDEPVLWMGDMNIAADRRDVFDPDYHEGRICFHPDERAALARLVEWGFTDIFRKHVPDDGEYTFFDYRIRNAVEHNLGWRLDCIMATEPLAERSREAWIDMAPRLAEKPSDHTPVCAEFDM